MDTETTPEAEAPEVEVEAFEDIETELDEHGNPVEPEPEDDHEEIEKDGLKFRIPKALKGDFLMQQDYTRKTQELAEQRRTFQQEREQYGQLSQAELAAQAQVYTIDSALKEYQQIDWRTWQDTDPAAASKAFTEYQLLKDQRQGAMGQYANAQQQRTLQEQRESAERMQQGAEVLKREIPGWGEDKAKALLDFGHQLGFSRQELNEIDDPRVIVALHYAHQGKANAAKQQTTARVQAQQSVQPAAKVTGGKAPARSLDDRASTDAWMKARQAQVAKR